MFQAKVLQLILITSVLSTSQHFSPETDHCYARNENRYVKVGTKTAYHFIHGGERGYKTIPKCKPVMIWMMIRHGTRYPVQSEINQMKSLSMLQTQIIYNHEILRSGHLCPEDLQNLKRWRLSEFITYENSELVNDQGFKDMNEFGKRIGNNFPALFPPSVTEISERIYKFRRASGTRMITSLKAFMGGLLGRDDIPEEQLEANSRLWTGYSQCPRWETEVANNPEHLTEITKFSNGSEYRNMISSVSARLGFPHDINKRIIYHMWTMCSYDMALNVTKLSPWCAVFTDEEMRVFEYRDALIDYYKRGNAHEYNVRLGCPPLRDMVDSFRKIEGNDDSYSMEPRGVFNVGRSRSYHLFMAALGIANDSSPLLASDFKLRKKYLWNTTEIGSFGANIAAVFYKCNDSASPNKVKFYQTEKPVDYPGCVDGLCDWEYLKSKFRKQLLECDNVDFCYKTSTEPSPVNSLPVAKFVLISSVLILIIFRKRHMVRMSKKFLVSCNRCRNTSLI
ncbi:multiple inositol polyphosphate phosphatase 1-like isoform X4 [Neodiprion lecontei]|uniref:Multiple inositol polyphosphate phosphatase 1 n=1 Tax=Neodiprion lecontei TaxID=441921 RepID=A0A6J0BJK8_NEOLC|nr:multiple inositol polyphosphate phosphatase 1-like isoform X4 [Neodiprion lecontei]